MSQAIYIRKINIPSDRLPIIILTARDRNKRREDILDNLPEKTKSQLLSRFFPVKLNNINPNISAQ